MTAAGANVLANGTGDAQHGDSSPEDSGPEGAEAGDGCASGAGADEVAGKNGVAEPSNESEPADDGAAAAPMDADASAHESEAAEPMDAASGDGAGGGVAAVRRRQAEDIRAALLKRVLPALRAQLVAKGDVSTPASGRCRCGWRPVQFCALQSMCNLSLTLLARQHRTAPPAWEKLPPLDPCVHTTESKSGQGYKFAISGLCPQARCKHLYLAQPASLGGGLGGGRHGAHPGAAQVVRAPVGLAVVKVLGLVPEADRRAALPGVLQAVANLLKARHQGVRWGPTPRSTPGQARAVTASQGDATETMSVHPVSTPHVHACRIAHVPPVRFHQGVQ